MEQKESPVKRSPAKKILDNIYDLPDSVRQEITEALLDLSVDSAEAMEAESEAVLLGDYKDEIDERDATFGQIVGVRSYYTVIDDMTMGLAEGELIIVAGPTSSGKTLTCMNIAANIIARGKSVGFATLEMTKGEFGSRMKRILESLWEEEHATSGDRYASLLDSVVVNKADKMDWRSIEPFVKKCVENGCDIVFIDHLHYFTRSMTNTAEELGKITQEFKYCAIKYKVPIVLISHTRKTDTPDGRERKAGIGDLRGSSYIAQDADIVLMINKVKNEQVGADGSAYKVVDDSKLEITLEKNRNRYGVPVGTKWLMDKNGLRISARMNTEQRQAWNRNKPDRVQSPTSFSSISHSPTDSFQTGNFTM